MRPADEELKNPGKRLAERGLAPNKRFGQNFLTDESVLDRIVDAAGLTGEETVLEIGPGTGALTRKLAQAAGQVTAVEIDRGLAAMLQEEFADNERVRVCCADILKTDLPALFPGKEQVRVVANLPYYITTPILLSLLPMRTLFSRFVVMMQREVADRMKAEPGSSAYGALSLTVQYYAQAEIITLVPPEAFYPSPEVTSAVLRLDRLDPPPVDVRDPGRMFAIIRAAFGKRRKTLVNALSGAHLEGITPERIRTVLHELGIDPAVRGEVLSLRDFAELSDRL